MADDRRSRHAFHNTFGDSSSNNPVNDQFARQGTLNPQTFGLTSNYAGSDQNAPGFSPAHSLQTQGPSHLSSMHGGSINTNRNSSIGQISVSDGTSASSRSLMPGSNVVSSPFAQTSSLPTNPVSTPFKAASHVPNPGLGPVYTPATSPTAPVQPFMNAYGNYGADYSGFSQASPGVPLPPNVATAYNATPVGLPNPSPGYGNAAVPAFSNMSSVHSNASYTSNQSQPSQDMSRMYLEGQFNQATYPSQPSYNSSINSLRAPNQNAVAPNATFNPNAVNLSNLSQGINLFQPAGVNASSPLQAQLGAQLTRFGEIYNQRLQQSEREDEVDPPILDELGINVVEMYRHFMAVVLPKKGNEIFKEYDDLYGPLLVFVAFAVGLMLSGKICFSTVYVLFVFCNVGIYMLFNFINEGYLTFSRTVTILGYSLLPLCLTPLFGILSRFIRVVPVVLVYLFVAWSTLSASYLFQVELGPKGRFYFVMYPVLLYYTTFANIVIF